MQTHLKEKFLLFRIRTKKDPDAFGEIYDMYIHRIYRFVYFKVPSTEVAEDLTSDTFLKAWQYLMEKQNVPHLQALLYRIARNNVIDWYRTNAKTAGDISLDEMVSHDLQRSGTESLLKDLEVKMDVAVIVEKLHSIKDEYREVIVMKYLDEMSTKEIASALGKSSSNVRVMLHRALHALGDNIESVEINSK